MEQKIIQIGKYAFQALRLPTEHTAVLLIQGMKGNLGCGYFSLRPAEKTGDCFAVVSGVKNFEEMLEAVVLSASSAARAAGVEAGVTTGREALILMEQ